MNNSKNCAGGPSSLKEKRAKIKQFAQLYQKIVPPKKQKEKENANPVSVNNTPLSKQQIARKTRIEN